ncbi:1-acyl-sn-glycerol-3-phosphate acyltransferase alpha [Melopsittacus undulatus]|uniref:1-acyl-sn-glycerol-3-phosphate acyltransferase n=1 Tax=Melopsittacus undulatus TaxID=13146 RepID=A0A8C6JKH7_MELUD|nr:1-acyl-sn-glycerol-3-phosphate acyltransferase alpha [Melopsittacus undulatus]
MLLGIPCAIHPDPGLSSSASSCWGNMMDVVLLHGLLLLLPLAALLLYRYNATFHYFCKVAFFNCWIIAMATLLSPFAALRGRSVENMKLLRAAILPLKHFYGIKMQVWGLEHLNTEELYVIVSNHQAALDLMGMVEIIPDRCVPIAKKEILYMGTVGWASWLSGIIFVDRYKREDAINVISQTARTMQREKFRVWIFPEGTRNQDKSMLPFKRGAFHLAVQAQVPIFPVVFSPYWDFFSSKEKKFTSGTCTIQILPKVETQGLSSTDVPRLTDTVRQAMADAFAEMSVSCCEDQSAEHPQHPHCAGVGAGAGRGTGSPQCEENTTGTSN